MRNRTYDRTYQQELFAQRTPYLQWLSAQEDMERTLDRPDAGKQICTLPFSSCMDSVSGYGAFNAEKIYLFARTGGSLTPGAERVIAEAFGDHPETALVYADEDYCGSLSALYRIDDETAQGKTYRGAPWFKPDFSPDTLYSFFYLGSVFAVRGGALLGITGEHGKDINLYELVYWIFREVLMKERSRQESEVVHLARCSTPMTLWRPRTGWMAQGRSKSCTRQKFCQRSRYPSSFPARTMQKYYAGVWKP